MRTEEQNARIIGSVASSLIFFVTAILLLGAPILLHPESAWKIFLGITISFIVAFFSLTNFLIAIVFINTKGIPLLSDIHEWIGYLIITIATNNNVNQDSYPQNTSFQSMDTEANWQRYYHDQRVNKTARDYQLSDWQREQLRRQSSPWDSDQQVKEKARRL